MIDAANAFSGHQSLKRPADLFLVLIFSSCNTFVVFLRELRTVSATYSTRVGGIHDYIVANPESALAQMVDPEIQKQKLRNAANNLVQTFLPALDIKRSPVALLLREIVARQVLEAAVDAFSDPDAVNKWILYFLQKEENIKVLASEMTEASSQQSVRSASTPNALDLEKAGFMPPTQPQFTDVVTDHPEVVNEQSFITSQNAASSVQTLVDDAAVRRVPRQPAPPPTSAMAESSLVSGQDRNSTSPDSQSPLSGASIKRVPRKPIGNNTSPPGFAEPEEKPDMSDIPEYRPSTTVPPPVTFDEMFGTPEFMASSSSLVRAPSTSSTNSTISATPTAAGPTSFSRKPTHDSPPLTLFQSNIMVIDSSADNNQAAKLLTSRPIGFYTLVIEPASSTSPGWMAMRNLSDFEKLHTVLSKLAVLAGLKMFPEVFPPWSGVTRADYCQTLQSYLQLVVNTRELADCEAMKKFVDKKETTSTAGEKRWQKNQLFKHAGEGVLDAISKATNATSAKESRKAILGVLAAAKKQSADSITRTRDNASATTSRARQSFLAGPDFSGIAASMRHLTNGVSGIGTGNANTNQQHLIADSAPSLVGYNAEANESSTSLSSLGDSISIVGGAECSAPSEPETYATELSRRRSVMSPSSTSTPTLNVSSSSTMRRTESHASSEADMYEQGSPRQSFSADQAPATESDLRTRATIDHSDMRRSAILASHQELSQGETNSLIDTIFLATSELYLLSKAWNVRRSLLTMLRGLLLRNGSSSVEGIRLAIQTDIIDKYSSEEEIARKLDDLINAVWPTEEEQSRREKEKAETDSEALRAEARKMFISRAVPDAIKSVMGAAASSQALEYVFDVLQDRNIARGIVLDLLMDLITTALM